LKINLDLKSINAYLLGVIYIAATLNTIRLFEQVSLLTLVTALFCAMVVLEFLGRGFEAQFLHPYFLLPLLLIALCWASGLWTVIPSVTATQNYSYTILPLWFIMTHLSDLREKDLEVIDQFIIAGAGIYVLYVLMTQGFSGVMSGRFATVEGMDQNATCASLFFVSTVLVKNILQRYKLGKNIVLQCLILLLVIWLFIMTGSRGGLLAAAAFAYIVGMYGRKNKTLRIVLLAVVALAAVYVVAPMVLPASIYDRMFNMDSYQSVITSPKNRVAIWTYCFTALVPGIPFYGYGTGVPPYLIGGHFGYVYRGIHNSYLAMFLEFGYLGLPLFLGLMACITAKLAKNTDRICLGAMVGILIIIFFLESYSRTYLWCILTYCMISSKRDPAPTLNQL